MKSFVCVLAVVVATCSAGYIGGSGGHRHVKIINEQPAHNHGVKIVKVFQTSQQPQVNIVKVFHQQPEVKTIKVIREHSGGNVETLNIFHEDGGAGNRGYAERDYPVGGGAGLGAFDTHKSLRNFGGSGGSGGPVDSYGVPITGTGYH